MWLAQCVQSRSVKNAVFYVMRYKQTQKCSCGEAQLHVACSDFLVGVDLLGCWWLTVKIPAELDVFSPLCVFWNVLTTVTFCASGISFASGLFFHGSNCTKIKQIIK